MAVAGYDPMRVAGRPLGLQVGNPLVLWGLLAFGAVGWLATSSSWGPLGLYVGNLQLAGRPLGL